MLLPAMGEIPYEARRMYLCIDEYQNGEITGRFFSAFEPEAFTFCSLLALMRYIDNLLDRTMMTQRYEERRTLMKVPVTGAPAKPREEWKTFHCPTAKLATFCLNIQFRQNATWQGEVTWLEQKQSSFFRSGLELFRMIDDVLLYHA